MADTNLNIATFDQISTKLSQLMTNYSNLASNYYNLFYNTTPMTLTLQLYNAEGSLITYQIPNRASDFRYVQNGEGAPEGAVVATVGTIYQDTLNGNLYIKQLGSGNTGWEDIQTGSEIEKGSSSPEGVLVRPQGSIYLDTDASALYIKSTSVGNTGWLLVSSNTNLLANIDLDNLSSEGELHFLGAPQLHSCILSAPILLTRSGNNITLHANTVMLASNGRNSNNQMNNVRITLSSNILNTLSGYYSSTVRVFYDVAENKLRFCDNSYFSEGVETPTILNTSAIWWNPDTNYYSIVSGGSWVSRVLVEVGQVTTNTLGNIDSITPKKPISLQYVGSKNVTIDRGVISAGINVSYEV